MSADDETIAGAPATASPHGEGVNIDVDIRTLSVDQLDKLAARAVQARQVARDAKQAAAEVTSATAYIGSAETALGYRPPAVPGAPVGPTDLTSAQFRRSAGKYGAGFPSAYTAYAHQQPIGGMGGPPTIPYTTDEDVRARTAAEKEARKAAREGAKREENERIKMERRQEAQVLKNQKAAAREAQRRERAYAKALDVSEQQHYNMGRVERAAGGGRAAEAARLAKFEAGKYAAAVAIEPGSGLAAGVSPVSPPAGAGAERGDVLGLTSTGLPIDTPRRAQAMRGAFNRREFVSGLEAESAAFAAAEQGGPALGGYLKEFQAFLSNPPAATLRWLTAAPFLGKLTVAIFGAAAAAGIIEHQLRIYFSPGQAGDIRKTFRDAARYIEGIAPLVDYRAGRVFFTAGTKVEQALPEFTYTESLRDGELRYRQLHQGSLV